MPPASFQPEITTQVTSRYVAEGDAFVDGLTVSVSKVTWIPLGCNPIEVTATGLLQRPLHETPTDAHPPPAGARPRGTAQSHGRHRPGVIRLPSPRPRAGSGGHDDRRGAGHRHLVRVVDAEHALRGQRRRRDLRRDAPVHGERRADALHRSAVR